MKKSKRLITLVLSAVLAGSMTCPAWAAQTYTIKDEVSTKYGFSANPYLVKITADEVKADGKIYVSENFGNLDVYRCKGAVTIDAIDCVSFPGIMDSFTYAKDVHTLAASPHSAEWLPLKDGTFTKTGAYLFNSTITSKSGELIPSKVQFVFIIEDGKSTTTAQDYELKSFSDVPASRWSYNAIMEMVNQGLFSGTKKPNAAGVGEFSPTGKMTRAQFVSVIVRHLYNDELNSLTAGRYWYSNSYDVAKNHGIVRINEFSVEDMDKPITRQEMAMVAVRAMNEKKVDMPQMADKSEIADFNKVDRYYQDFVRWAFASGVISGYDEKGTFGPTDTLTREQGALVAYRIVNAKGAVQAVPAVKQETAKEETIDIVLANGVVVPVSTTKKEYITFHKANGTTVQYPKDPAYENQSVDGILTIYEGQKTIRPAREGDIFVKADGTKITLKKGPHGILGEGQGVAPDENLHGYSGLWTGTRFNFDADVDGRWTDGTGKTLQNNNYQINRTTGEGHWSSEWQVLTKAYPEPAEDGFYSGQVSTDPLSLWSWSAILDDWLTNTTR